MAPATPVQVALVGTTGDPDASALQEATYATYAPNRVVAIRRGDQADDGSVPLLEGRVTVDSLPTAYVCENFTCRLPTNDPHELAKQIAAAVVPKT